MEPKCYAVNKNDYLGTIYIYYASNYSLDKTFTVSVLLSDSTIVTGSATYDANTDRVIYIPANPICLTKITTITYK